MACVTLVYFVLSMCYSMLWFRGLWIAKAKALTLTPDRTIYIFPSFLVCLFDCPHCQCHHWLWHNKLLSYLLPMLHSQCNPVYFLFRFMYYNLKPFHLKKKSTFSPSSKADLWERIYICKTKLKKKTWNGVGFDDRFIFLSAAWSRSLYGVID